MAVVSLALGIGANAAIFSLFDQMLLRALPVQQPDRLVNLGADGRSVRGMVLRQVGRMMVVGGIGGVAAAVGLSRIVKSLLFELEGHDPSVVLGAIVVLSLVALGAGFFPAHRASRVEPMHSLRYE